MKKKKKFFRTGASVSAAAVVASAAAHLVPTAAAVGSWLLSPPCILLSAPLPACDSTNQSLWCAITSPILRGHPGPDARAYSVKGGTEDGQWRLLQHPRPGWDQCPHFIKKAELRAEYMGGKEPRQSAQGGQQRKRPPQQQQTRRRCRSERAANGNQASDTWNATSPCEVTVRRAEVICRLWPVITTAIFSF